MEHNTLRGNVRGMEYEHQCILFVPFIEHGITWQSQVFIQSGCRANASFDNVAVKALRNVVPIVIREVIFVVDPGLLRDRCENLESFTKDQDQVSYSSSPDAALVVVSHYDPERR